LQKQNKQKTGVIINDLMYWLHMRIFFFFVFFVIDLDYLNHILDNGRLFISILSDHSKIMSADLQLPVQSVPITTKVVSSNLVHGEVYLIQHYVIKFVSDLVFPGYSDFLH